MSVGFVASKLLRAVITIWLVLTFVFIVLRLSGDPASQLLPDDVDPDTVAAYRHAWGLDRPLWEQYVRYFQSAFQGNFGISFRDGQQALTVVMERVPETLRLGLTSFAFALLLGIPLGVVAALYRDTIVDRFVMSFAVFGYSMPNFFLGVLLILLFSLQYRLLPSSGSGSWLHMIMPVFTLSTAFAGSLARFTRSAVLEVLSKSYVRTARAKGMMPWREVVVHALPNAGIPVVTVVGFKLGALIGGSVITESVFAWPGVGRLLVSAVANRDLAVVQTIVVLIAFTMVTANLIVDLLYGWLDPRIRLSGHTGD